jgi:hypothetical protein
VIKVVVCQKNQQLSWEFIDDLGKLLCTSILKA